MSCLYIFDTNSLSVASFAIIFSHSEGYLSILLIVSFIVQKLLNLIRPHLFLLLFPLLWVIENPAGGFFTPESLGKPEIFLDQGLNQCPLL